MSGPCHLGHMVLFSKVGLPVGGRDLNWEKIPLTEVQPGVWCQWSEPKTRGLQAGFMWTWVLSGPCHLGHMVPSRVEGVVVGGRDLNQEKIPLTEGWRGVWCQWSETKTRGLQAGCMWTWVLSGPCHLGHMVPSRVAGVAGRDLNLERIPLLLYCLCLSDHHPTNRTELTHPCPSVVHFRLPGSP